MKRLNQFVSKRKATAKKYDESFSNLENLKIPKTANNVDHAYHLYPLQINFSKLKLTKLKFFEEIKKAGINLQVHYLPVHLQPFYKKNYGFQTNDFPVSESFYKKEISLPIYPTLSKDEITLVINKVMEIVHP